MVPAHLTRLRLSASVTALLLIVTPAPLAAQGAGNIGGDSSTRGETSSLPSSSGFTITPHAPQIELGHVLGGQGDVPAEERLRTPDKITFSATWAGTGGGPEQGGGQCTPSAVTLDIEVALPGIVPHMSPPGLASGGRGGVVTIPTWFWATWVGDPAPSSTKSEGYTTCSPHPDPVLGQTWWSPSQRTATIGLSSAPTGYVWDFGDREVSASCAGNSSGPNALGNADQPTIQHQYCVSSIRGQHPDGYPVFIKAQFIATATVDDQTLLQMPVMTSNISRFDVREVQAVLDE